MLCYPSIDWIEERSTVTGLIAITGDDGSGDGVGIIREGRSKTGAMAEILIIVNTCRQAFSIG